MSLTDEQLQAIHERADKFQPGDNEAWTEMIINQLLDTIDELKKEVGTYELLVDAQNETVAELVDDHNDEIERLKKDIILKELVIDAYKAVDRYQPELKVEKCFYCDKEQQYMFKEGPVMNLTTGEVSYRNHCGDKHD